MFMISKVVVLCCKKKIVTLKIVHVYREGNRAADWLINKGVAQLINISFIDSIPIGLARLLEEDIQGVAIIPRLVPL